MVNKRMKVGLLTLDRPNRATGTIYPKEEIVKWLEVKYDGSPLLGEWGQQNTMDRLSANPHGNYTQQIQTVNPEIEGDGLVGYVEPRGAGRMDDPDLRAITSELYGSHNKCKDDKQKRKEKKSFSITC